MKSRFKQSLGSKLFDVLNVVIMVLILIVMLYPFINQLAISFNDSTDAIRGGIYLWPRKFSLDAYKFVLADDDLLRVTMTSVMRVLVGTSTSVIATAFLAYIITINHFSGRKFMRRLFVLTMYFSGGLIPAYLLMVSLGINESFTIYWLPSMFSAYNMLLIASYMQSVPDTLRESARIDGASEVTIFLKIMIPMCLPVLAAICIFNGVGHWNSWFDTMIYNPSGKFDTLQVYLRRILLETEALSKITDQQQAANEMAKLTVVTVRAATTMIVTLPIAVIYPFFQKYFVSGITLGAVKE
ncbi:MAG: carbohydrate ABC transporter permease [Turicibacter sp.]